MVKRPVARRKQTIQQRYLRRSARISVEDEALIGGNGVHMFAKDFRHQLVGKQFPGLHDFIRHFADIRTSLNRRTKDVASGQLDHAIFRHQKCSLCALACARRPQKDDIHETFPRFVSMSHRLAGASTLQLRLFQQVTILVGKQMALYLRDRVDGDIHQNKKTGSANGKELLLPRLCHHIIR